MICPTPHSHLGAKLVPPAPNAQPDVWQISLMLGKLKQSEKHSVSGPGSRRCRGRKSRSPRRVRPSNWAEAPEASLGRSGCAGGRARPGEEAPWGRLKGAERGSGRRAEGTRAVCGQVDGTRRAAVLGHRGAQGAGSCRETGAPRSLA